MGRHVSVVEQKIFKTFFLSLGNCRKLKTGVVCQIINSFVEGNLKRALGGDLSIGTLILSKDVEL